MLHIFSIKYAQNGPRLILCKSMAGWARKSRIDSRFLAELVPPRGLNNKKSRVVSSPTRDGAVGGVL